LLLVLLSMSPVGGIAQQIVPPTASRTLAGADLATILGRSVWDSGGDVVGQLVDVLVDHAGKTIAGVIDVGGFLGVGTRRIAVAWSLLHVVRVNDETHIVMDVTYDTAASAPEYRGPDNTIFVIDRAPR